MTRDIRPATLADLDVIIDFNRRLAEETEGKKLDPARLRRGVQAMLADPHKGVYFVAAEQGQVVGQLGVTQEWSDWRNGFFWWIQSVYVRQDARRRGVFRSLFLHVAEAARRAADVIGIRLYVDEHNGKAQATYGRLGLVKTDYWLLEKELSTDFTDYTDLKNCF